MSHERPRPDDEVDAQQLMVLGRLAGGIAHDFNNQLTSILGYTDLLLFDLPSDSPVRQDLLEIRHAAERAHIVTRQLLAFSRPHHAEPSIVNVADVVTGHVHLLRRVLGDDIRLVTSIQRDAIERDPSLGRADPGRLGHLLIYLGVRARHALPRGGTLTIAVANDPAAACVRMSVQALGPSSGTDSGTDSGTGSGSGSGSGTGSGSGSGTETRTDLGLPVIEDIVRQCGGRLRFDRADAGGERATVDLPRVEARDEGVAVDSAPPRGIERVLVVDDDGSVRDLVRTILERYGYQVQVAARPTQALALARVPSARMDLAIVDVALPEQRGDALATDLIALRPGLRLLYISGDTDADIGALRTGPASFFLRKPFTAAELLITVRQALDSAAV